MLSDYDVDTIQKYLTDFKTYRKQLDRFERKYGTQKDAVRNPFWMFECEPYRSSKKDYLKQKDWEYVNLPRQKTEIEKKKKPEYIVHDIPFVREVKKEKKKKPEYVVHDIPFVRDDRNKQERDYVVHDIPYIKEDRNKKQDSEYVVRDMSTFTPSSDESTVSPSFANEIEDESLTRERSADYLQRLVDAAEKIHDVEVGKISDTVMLSPVSKSVGLTPLPSIEDLRKQRIERRKSLEQQQPELEQEKFFRERQRRRQEQTERSFREHFEGLEKDLRKE